MTDMVSIITSVGFPIFACLALGVFIYKFTTNLVNDSKEREQKLYELIGQCQATNEKFVEQLEEMQKSIVSIKDDVDDIKNKLDEK